MKNQKLQLKGAKKLTREDQKSILGGSPRIQCCLHDACGNCVLRWPVAADQDPGGGFCRFQAVSGHLHLRPSLCVPI